MHFEAAFRSTPTRIYKVAWQHLSSHVGDEYAERTGRRRIAYTRNELAGGISERLGERWRAYGEIGWGYSLKNNDLQEPGRVQGGRNSNCREANDCSTSNGTLPWTSRPCRRATGDLI